MNDPDTSNELPLTDPPTPRRGRPRKTVDSSDMVEYGVARAIVMALWHETLKRGVLPDMPDDQLCLCWQQFWNNVPWDSHSEACAAAHFFCFPESRPTEAAPASPTAEPAPDDLAEF